MKAYIVRACSVSLQPSFQKSILDCMQEQRSECAVEPDYSTIIPSSALRRMTKVIRLGVGTAMTVAKDQPVAGIIVGTGMGCYDSSLSFTQQYTQNREGALSPGAFILSSDNMIASQIAIAIRSNAYNITYVNRGMSFENALVDAILLTEEKQGDVLVGGVDEHIPYFQLSDAAMREYPELIAGEGATFFLLSHIKPDNGVIIEHCSTERKVSDDIGKWMMEFLDRHHLILPDLILFGNSFVRRNHVPEQIANIPVYDYTILCGTFFTNSAFGVQLAFEILSKPDKSLRQGFKAKRILVINDFESGLFGLTYLSLER